MIGFASAGSGFATTVRDENVWSFRSLSILLACSRLMLAIQYSTATAFLHKKMKLAARHLSFTVVVLFATSTAYTGVSLQLLLLKLQSK